MLLSFSMLCHSLPLLWLSIFYATPSFSTTHVLSGGCQSSRFSMSLVGVYTPHIYITANPFNNISSLYYQLRALQMTFSNRNNQIEQPHTLRRRVHQGRQERRDFSAGGQTKRSSRSRSPCRPTPTKHPLATPNLSVPSSSTKLFFHPPSKPPFHLGADSKSSPVCAICLERNICQVNKCRSEIFWDGVKARYRKKQPRKAYHPDPYHLASRLEHSPRLFLCQAQLCCGCGGKDHGAQSCPRAQKDLASRTV